MMPRPATASTPSWPHFAESASPTMIIETTAMPMPRPVSTRTWRSTASTSTPKPRSRPRRAARGSRGPTLIAMAASWRTSSGTITIEKMRREPPLRLRHLLDVEHHADERAREPREHEEQRRVHSGAEEAVERTH